MLICGETNTSHLRRRVFYSCPLMLKTHPPAVQSHRLIELLFSLMFGSSSLKTIHFVLFLVNPIKLYITVPFQQGHIIIRFYSALYCLNGLLNDSIKIMQMESKFLQTTMFHLNQMITEPI